MFRFFHIGGLKCSKSASPNSGERAPAGALQPLRATRAASASVIELLSAASRGSTRQRLKELSDFRRHRRGGAQG
jgi:hypothetical protein